MFTHTQMTFKDKFHSYTAKPHPSNAAGTWSMDVMTLNILTHVSDGMSLTTPVECVQSSYTTFKQPNGYLHAVHVL